ncbi:MAG: hypothetical protein L0Z62_23880 [Gemmataceae bacterium]|nr:hypothetical protein [Gemmataceae bacterium]
MSASTLSPPKRWLYAAAVSAVITCFTTCLTVGPKVICRAAAEALVGAWQAVADRVVYHDLRQLDSSLDDLRSRLERVRGRREGLTQLLHKAESDRTAASHRLADDRAVLSQIADLLRSQPGDAVTVDGAEYDRVVVERDAEKYRRRCTSGEAELRKFDAAVAELADGVARIDRYIAGAENVLRARQDEFSRLQIQAEAHRLRREIAALLEEEGTHPTGGADGWERRAERTATFLAPVRSAAAVPGPAQGSGEN